jgi:hypothetical protein
MKLAAMMRIVRVVQFIFDKLAALLRGKRSDEMRASKFLGEASCIKIHSRPATTRLRKRTTSQIEKS